jgi:AraC-like DNA-binding protein
MRQIIYEESMTGITISRLIRNYEYSMPSKHIHDEYEIYYLISGERSYFIKDRIYHIEAGSLVFINKNTIHMTTQSGASYHERIVIEFRDEPLSSLFACTGELNLAEFFSTYQGVIQVPPGERNYILSLLDGIGRELNIQDPGYRLMALDKLARLLCFSFRYLKCNKPSSTLSTTAAHQKVTEVASYISAHYIEATSLDQVARRFYMSKSYLSRIFKEVTGYTVNEYINVNRIQKARELLAESSLSIAEIARFLGYGSLTYFEKIFRQHTEISPLKYRKQCLREKEQVISSIRPQSYLGEQSEITK